MQFDFLENEHEMRAFSFSVGVVLLSIIAVVVFVFSGGSVFFYVFALMAIILGLYMAYHISQANTQAAARTQKKKQRKQ